MFSMYFLQTLLTDCVSRAGSWSVCSPVVKELCASCFGFLGVGMRLRSGPATQALLLADGVSYDDSVILVVLSMFFEFIVMRNELSGELGL